MRPILRTDSSRGLVVSVQDYLVEATAQEAGLTIPEKGLRRRSASDRKEGSLGEASGDP